MFRRSKKVSSPPIKIRLLSINKIFKFINNSTLTKIKEIKKLEKSKNLKNLPTPIYKYFRNNDQILETFMNYCLTNKNTFNFSNCTKYLQISDFEGFLTLLGAMEMGLVSFQDEL